MNVVTQMLAMLIALAIAGGFGYAIYLVINVLIDGLNAVSNEVRVYVLGGILGLITSAIVVTFGLWRIARSVTVARSMPNRLWLYRRVIGLLVEGDCCPADAQRQALVDLKPQMLLLAPEQVYSEYLQFVALLGRQEPIDDEAQERCRNLICAMQRDLGRSGSDAGGDIWSSGRLSGASEIDAARST